MNNIVALAMILFFFVVYLDIEEIRDKKRRLLIIRGAFISNNGENTLLKLGVTHFYYG